MEIKGQFVVGCLLSVALGMITKKNSALPSDLSEGVAQLYPNKSAAGYCGIAPSQLKNQKFYACLPSNLVKELKLCGKDVEIVAPKKETESIVVTVIDLHEWDPTFFMLSDSALRKLSLQAGDKILWRVHAPPVKSDPIGYRAVAELYSPLPGSTNSCNMQPEGTLTAALHRTFVGDCPNPNNDQRCGCYAVVFSEGRHVPVQVVDTFMDDRRTDHMMLSADAMRALKIKPGAEISWVWQEPIAYLASERKFSGASSGGAMNFYEQFRQQEEEDQQ